MLACATNRLRSSDVFIRNPTPLYKLLFFAWCRSSPKSRCLYRSQFAFDPCRAFIHRYLVALSSGSQLVLRPVATVKQQTTVTIANVQGTIGLALNTFVPQRNPASHPNVA